MATAEQISLVRRTHRRVKELLKDTGVKFSMSFTSDTQTLRITYSKKYSRPSSTLEISRIITQVELLQSPEFLDAIVAEDLRRFPSPAASVWVCPRVFCDYLNYLISNYNSTLGSDARPVTRCIRVTSQQEIHICINNRDNDFGILQPDGTLAGIFHPPYNYAAAEEYFLKRMCAATDGQFNEQLLSQTPVAQTTDYPF